MTKGEKIMARVMEYVKNIRNQYPEITDDMLCKDGELFYMNSTNGTYFDWNVNQKLSPMFLFYKDTELGFLKIQIYNDDMVYGCVYLDGGNADPIRIKETYLDKGDAKYLYKLLLQETDHKHLFDRVLDSHILGNTLERKEVRRKYVRRSSVQ